MPLSRSRDYLSISELLEAVRKDFPDISISKIRFLETEGLLRPQRTGSGYRKFYEADVARLRRILELQKHHFLPLKVIKERIESGSEEDAAPPPGPAAPARRSGASPAPVMTGVQMDRSELLKSSGLTDAQLRGLEEFRLVEAREGVYEENALMVARAARGFFELGVEPRHLRMYRQFAERELAMFEQLLAPLTRHKDERSVTEARATIERLEGSSRTMKDATLRAALQSLS